MTDPIGGGALQRAAEAHADARSSAELLPGHISLVLPDLQAILRDFDHVPLNPEQHEALEASRHHLQRLDVELRRLSAAYLNGLETYQG